MSGSDAKPMDWTRQDGESNLWFSRFILFRDKGTERTLVSAYRLHLGHQGKYKQPDFAPGSWKSTYRKWQWAARAEMWDADQLRLRDARNLKRQIELEDLTFEVGVIAINKAKSMLSWPLATQTVEGDDGKTTVVTPAGWSQGTAGNLLRAGTTAAREACGVGLIKTQPSPGSPEADHDEYLTLDDIKFLTEFVKPSESPETS